MNIGESPKKKNLISLTPLIDVVFILLVFFMLVSNFSTWQEIELGLNSNQSQQTTLDNKHSIINVGFNHVYLLDGKTMALNDIKQTLKQRLKTDEQHQVLIQAEGKLPIQALMPVLDNIAPIASDNMSLSKQVMPVTLIK